MKFILCYLSVLILLSADIIAQNFKAPRPSPDATITQYVGITKITVDYSSPGVKERKIWGELVPYGKIWRTGANEATHLKTNFDMVIGGVPLTKGTYTLWTFPTPAGWKFIINKQTGQWGTNYDERQDYARFDAIVEQMETPVETLTVTFDATSETSGRLKLMW